VFCQCVHSEPSGANCKGYDTTAAACVGSTISEKGGKFNVDGGKHWLILHFNFNSKSCVGGFGSHGSSPNIGKNGVSLIEYWNREL
jgi:hypothetical protein